MSSNVRIGSAICLTLATMIFSNGQFVVAQQSSDDDLPIVMTDHLVQTSVDQTLEPIQVEEDATIIIQHEHRIIAVAGYDSDYLAVSAETPNRLRVNSINRATEQTVVMIDEFENKVFVEIHVTSHALRRLSDYLEKLFPEAELELYELNDSLLIRGTVPSEDLLTEVYDVAEEFYGGVLKHAKVEGAHSGAEKKALEIPPGMRVITVRVNESQGLTHHLGPGDWVNLLVTYQTRGARGINTYSKVLLEYVPIFAPPIFMDGEQGARVSLIVTPEQASYVQLAEKKGDLWLVLRRRLEDEQMQAGAIDSSLLEELTGLPERGAESELLAPEEVESESEAAQPDDLQTEIRALHADVKRLIELLEKRQANSESLPTESESTPENPMGPRGVDDDDETNQTKAADNLKLFYFYANWAEPSVTSQKLIDRIAESESVEVTKVNVDQHVELTKRYDVKALPALVLTREDEVLKQITGELGEDDVRNLIRRVSQPEFHEVAKALNVRLEPLSESERNELGDRYQGGLKIVDIFKSDSTGSPESVGLQVGDVLVGLGTHQTTNIQDVIPALASQTVTDKRHISWVQFCVIRGRFTLYGNLRVRGFDDRAALFFQASWCGPCQKMSPVIRQLTEAGYRIETVDVDSERELANRYRISSIPALVFTKGGVEVDRRVGVSSADEVKRLMAL